MTTKISDHNEGDRAALTVRRAAASFLLALAGLAACGAVAPLAHAAPPVVSERAQAFSGDRGLIRSL